MIKRTKLTAEQKRALQAYDFALREEDRFMGSVFVNAFSQRQQEAKTREAYERCKDLGMVYEYVL
jgi:hypothetical protein